MGREALPAYEYMTDVRATVLDSNDVQTHYLPDLALCVSLVGVDIETYYCDTEGHAGKFLSFRLAVLFAHGYAR